MPTLALRTSSEAATQAAGEALARLLRPGDVVLLSGDLGAGKTCLTRGIAQGLAVPTPVTSPTFNILVAHEGRIPLYHFDLYRLDHARQLEDIDYWGTLEADGVSVVEWGDRFPEAVPDDSLLVTMTIVGDEERLLSLSPRGSRSARLAEEWLLGCGALPGVEVLEA